MNEIRRPLTASSMCTDSCCSDKKHKYKPSNNNALPGFFNSHSQNRRMSGPVPTDVKPAIDVVNGREFTKQYTINKVPSAYERSSIRPQSKSKFFSRADTQLEDENFRGEKKAHIQEAFDLAEQQRREELTDLLPWQEPNAIKSKIQTQNPKFQKKKSLDNNDKDSEDAALKYCLLGPNSINLNTQGHLLAKTRDKLLSIEASQTKQITFMTPIEKVNDTSFNIAMEK